MVGERKENRKLLVKKAKFAKLNIFRTCAHLVEKIPEIFLRLYDLLPVFYLLIFYMLLLQPAHTRRHKIRIRCVCVYLYTSLLLVHMCRKLCHHLPCVSSCSVHHTHWMTTSRACPRETGLLLRKLKSSWWLR